MKWIIEDHTLYDTELTKGEYETAEKAIDHLAPVMDAHWQDEWFIKRSCGVYKLGVFNGLETDSFGIVAIIKRKPVPVPPPLPDELMGTMWEYCPPDKPHCPNTCTVTKVDGDMVRLENATSCSEVDREWLRKAYVQYHEDDFKPMCRWCGHRH